MARRLTAPAQRGETLRPPIPARNSAGVLGGITDSLESGAPEPRRTRDIQRQVQETTREQPQTPGLTDLVAEEPPQLDIVNQDFSNRFQESLAKSRARVNDQISSALEELARREQMGQQALGTVGPGVQQAFGAAESGIQEQAGLARDALTGAGIQASGDPTQGIQPVLGALQQDRAARMSDIPLLELGLQDLFARQRGALGQAAAEMQGQIGQEERSFLLNRLGAQDQARQLQQQQQFQQSQNALEFARQEAAAEQDFAREQALADLQQQQQIEFGQLTGQIPQQGADTTDPGAFAPTNVSPERGVALQVANPDLVAEIQNSPDFDELNEMFLRDFSDLGAEEAAARLQAEALRRNKPRTASLILAQAGGDVTPEQAAQIRAGQQQVQPQQPAQPQGGGQNNPLDFVTRLRGGGQGGAEQFLSGGLFGLLGG